MSRIAFRNGLPTGSGVLALSLALCGTSAAQTSGESPSRPTDDGGLEEVVVTANKRSESLQEVPLAVSVIGEDELRASGVTQFADLGKVSPSLTIRPAEHPANSNVSLRGVGTFAFGIGVESSVAVLVDEVPLAFQARAFSDLPDVERIEVLRGPQSTLYGKSASAGLINIITKSPTDSFEAHINALGTSDDEYGGNFSVSGPINPDLGYVFSASYSQWDGNVRNLFNGKDVNGREALNTRAKLRWAPSENTSLTFSADYIDGETTVGRPFIAMDPAALLRNTPGQSAAVVLPGITIDRDNSDISNNYDARTNYSGYGGSIRGEFGLGELQLVSITSYDRFNLGDYLDQDDSSATIPAGGNFQAGKFHSKLTTQEIRLLSPDTDAFRYTVGAYYGKVEFDRPFFRGPVFSLANWHATSESTQIAGFAQIDWTIVDDLTLTVGGRAQKEEIAYTFLDVQNGNAQFNGDSDDTATTYKISPQYQITPDVMVFATYATGYKGQTYDLTTGFNANRAAAGPIRPETSRDTEAGIRTQFLDRALTLNLTYFDTDYEDLQAQSIETLADGTNNFRLTNVGGLNSKGVELELAARLGEAFNLSASATFLDAKYTSFPVAQCYPLQTAAQGCTGTPARQNLTGTRAVQAPELKFQIAADYSHAISSNLVGFAQVAYQHQSDTYYVAEDPQTFQPAYGIANVGVGVRDESGKWKVVAFVNNLFDKQYYPAIANSAGNWGSRIATQVLLPRDFERYGGIRLSFDFD
ncbi:MAG TPA: TonB-dependent receptor [Steroidobacteraceae bacterium]|nr:TonB-dependent receptor [Steroidobacteraceae bacterium]